MFKFYLTLVGNIPINISTPRVFLPVEIFILFFFFPCKVDIYILPPHLFFLTEAGKYSRLFGFLLNSTQEKLEMYSIFCKLGKNC